MLEIFEFGKSPSGTVFAMAQSGLSNEFKVGDEPQPHSAEENGIGQMRMRAGPGPLEPASEGHLQQTPLASIHTQTTTSQAHSGASRSPWKVALQSHPEDTGISLTKRE